MHDIISSQGTVKFLPLFLCALLQQSHTLRVLEFKATQLVLVSYEKATAQLSMACHMTTPRLPKT